MAPGDKAGNSSMSSHILFTLGWFHALVLLLPIAMFLVYKWPQLWHHLLALFLGIVIAIVDSRTDDVQLPALFLLAFGFFLGFSQPQNPWRWATILAIWIPLVGFAKIIFEGADYKLARECVPALIAFIPALVGAYAGAWLKLS
jgi:hypothetical protein